MRAPLLLLIALLPLCTPTGCSPTPAPGPERLVVVERLSRWTPGERDGAAPTRAPLGQHWDAARLANTLVPIEGRLERQDEQLVLSGNGSVQAILPLDGELDGRVQQTWELTARCEQSGTLEWQWRAPDHDFDPRRRVRMEWTPNTAPRIARLRLDRALGSLHERAEPGPLAALRLRFTAAPAAVPAAVPAAAPAATPTAAGGSLPPLRLVIDELALLSDFDAPDGESRPLERRGIRRKGPLLRVPGSLWHEIRGGPGERLDLHLALAAAEEPVTIRLDDEQGRLAVQEFQLQPDAAWRGVSVDLSSAPGDRPTRLRLTARGAGGALVIGSPLHLAPASSAALTREGSPDPVDRRTPVAVLPSHPLAGPAPNVLLYLVDTLRADRLTPYGYPLPTSPELAALAARGVLVEQVLAPSNWTRPSVSTLLTGSAPARHGNLLPDQTIAADLPTLAQAFASAGWLTASFVTNHHAGPWSGLDRGFDVEFGPARFPPDDPPTTLSSSQVAAPLEEFLARHTGQRLFVYVHVIDPHAPYVPRAQDLQVLERAGDGEPSGDGNPAGQERFSPRYDAEIRNVDRELGALAAALDRHASGDPTLLAITADHGEAFFEHGTWGHWRGMFQEELAVPWILYWPGVLRAGARLSGRAGLGDVAPSLLGLAGLLPPAEWTGRDLSAALRAAGPSLPEATLVADSILDSQEQRGLRRLAAVRGGLKLIAERAPGGALHATGLYDLRADPSEQHDLLSADGGGLPVPSRDPDLDPQDRLDPRARELLGVLADYLRGADARRADVEQGDDASTLDPARQAWLREMGYLR